MAHLKNKITTTTIIITIITILLTMIAKPFVLEKLKFLNNFIVKDPVLNQPSMRVL